MEEVEEAHKAAIESCHRALNLLSQPQDQVACKTLTAETEEAVSKFKRVAYLLNNGVGHGRVRKQKITLSPLHQKMFLDHPMVPCRIESSPQPLQLLPRNLMERSAPEQDTTFRDSHPLAQKMLGSPALKLDPVSRCALQLIPQGTSSTPVQFLQQQQNNQRFQLQQHMKFHPDMFRRNNSGVSLKFESSSCTPTASTTRSFISSLSVDGSVANLDGNAFHLVGVPQPYDRMNLQQPPKRRCVGRGEDGNGKCGTSGRCHCSKRRKLRVKRSIKVPAISNKLADIPPDEYSWRKYGQKPIKGSPHPRKLKPVNWLCPIADDDCWRSHLFMFPLFIDPRIMFPEARVQANNPTGVRLLRILHFKRSYHYQQENYTRSRNPRLFCDGSCIYSSSRMDTGSLKGKGFKNFVPHLYMISVLTGILLYSFIL